MHSDLATKISQMSCSEFRALLTKLSTSPKERDRAIKIRCRDDIAFFAAYFFPEYCKVAFSEFHGDMFELKRSLDEERNQFWCIAAPRGNAKSVIITMIFTIHAICYKTEKYIVICSNVGGQAKERTMEIRTELEENPTLKRVYGDMTTKHWNQEDFKTRNGVRVVAKSAGSEIRGTRNRADRPTLFIFDDLENSDTIRSVALRNRTKTWFDTAPMKAGWSEGPYATNFLLVGTVLHQQSLMADKLKSARWKSRRYKAVKAWPTNANLWDDWKKIITDRRLGDERFAKAKQFHLDNYDDMMEGVEVLWPEGDGFYNLMLQIIDGGMAAFNAEKQNDPHDPDAQLFEMEKAKTFKIREHEGVRFLERSDGYIVKLSDLKIYGFLDPTLANTSGSDYASIVVMGVDQFRDQYVLDVWMQKMPPSRQIVAMYDLHVKWNFYQVGFENTLFQALLEPMFKKEADRRGVRLPVTGVPHYQSKEERVASMEPDIANGWLLFNEDLIDTEYWNQMSLFPTGNNDDGPDATQGCQELAGTSRLSAA